MSSVTIEEAQAKLTELIHQLGPGQEVVIIENDQPVAKLVVIGCRRGSVRSLDWPRG